MTRLEWQIFQVKHEKVLLHAFWLFFSFGYVVSLGFHIETQPEGRFEGSFAFFSPLYVKLKTLKCVYVQKVGASTYPFESLCVCRLRVSVL